MPDQLNVLADSPAALHLAHYRYRLAGQARHAAPLTRAGPWRHASAASSARRQRLKVLVPARPPGSDDHSRRLVFSGLQAPALARSAVRACDTGKSRICRASGSTRYHGGTKRVVRLRAMAPAAGCLCRCDVLESPGVLAGGHGDCGHVQPRPAGVSGGRRRRRRSSPAYCRVATRLSWTQTGLTQHARARSGAHRRSPASVA